MIRVVKTVERQERSEEISDGFQNESVGAQLREVGQREAAPPREFVRKGLVLFEAEGQPVTIDIWDSGRVDWRGQSDLGYRLCHGEETIFEDEDFASSPLEDHESSSTLAAVLAFLSVRPGDIGEEYFEDYTPRQLAWVESWGEALTSVAVQFEDMGMDMDRRAA